jgi:ADP-ribose pyrophosphatase YjhB (NUDIX family)
VILRGVFAVMKEATRHLIRRPFVMVAVAGRDARGQWLLVRRADGREWGLPCATVEWNETVTSCVSRALRDEANATVRGPLTLRGVYSAPRDARFHGVTVLVCCPVEAETSGQFFADTALPSPLASDVRDLLSAARASELVLE